MNKFLRTSILQLTALVSILALFGSVAPVQARATTIVFLTSGTSWTVPSDWTSSNNIIEVIGGGGSGAVATGWGLPDQSQATGGGGGGYSKITNITLTPGASIAYQIGTGGSAVAVTTSGATYSKSNGNTGGDTWFNGASCAAASVCAKGGSGGTSAAASYGGGTSFSGAQGGQAASGVGTLKYSGGNSGSISSSYKVNVSTGGGGAAGPRGNGNNGAAAAATQTGTNGGSGDAGYGGTAGSGVLTTGPASGGTGGNGTGYDATHGSGGGGGGSSCSNGVTSSTGGSGGQYGAGGGGASTLAPSGSITVTSGAGKNGLIIITYGGLKITGSAKFSSNLTITNMLLKSSGTFVIDHPLDPKNKLLYHSFVESPDAKNIYDGIAMLDKNGEAVVKLPNYFDSLNTDVRYQFFPIGRAMPNLHVKKMVDDNSFVLAGGVPGGKVSWQVSGIRQDPYILKHPIRVETEKGTIPDLPGKDACIFEPLCQ